MDVKANLVELNRPAQKDFSAFAAGCLGTGLLVATVIGSGIMAESLAAGNVAVALLANTIATAAMLYVLITIFGPVSGAHFNPAVTLVSHLRRDISGADALRYILLQISGGVAGAMLANLMFNLPAISLSHHARLGPSQWLSEFVATFSLVIAILGALRADVRLVPLVVALVITAAYWFTASTSFANPAVTIARALSDTFAGIAPGSVTAFIAAQLAGSLAAFAAAENIFGWRAAKS